MSVKFSIRNEGRQAAHPPALHVAVLNLKKWHHEYLGLSLDIPDRFEAEQLLQQTSLLSDHGAST